MSQFRVELSSGVRVFYQHSERGDDIETEYRYTVNNTGALLVHRVSLEDPTPTLVATFAPGAWVHVMRVPYRDVRFEAPPL